MRAAIGVITGFMLLGALATHNACAAADAPASPSAKDSPQGRTWSSIAKLPDWSGVWELDYRAGAGKGGGGLARPAPPHMTPEYAAKYAAYQERQKRGLEEQTETANCVPPGMPQIMAQPYPVEFLFTPGKVTVAIEAYSQMRRIFTDGRKHPDDPDPSFQGNSIGHWEGDTLVVDSIAFIPTSLIAPGVGHSDDMRIQERIHRSAADVLEITTTIEDPTVLTEPYTSTRYYKRHKEYDINEYICTQNNRDSADSEGRAGLKIER
jgi:hypothetical protein